MFRLQWLAITRPKLQAQAIQEDFTGLFHKYDLNLQQMGIYIRYKRYETYEIREKFNLS